MDGFTDVLVRAYYTVSLFNLKDVRYEQRQVLWVDHSGSITKDM